MDISNSDSDSWLTVGTCGLNVVVKGILPNLVRWPHLTEGVIGGHPGILLSSRPNPGIALARIAQALAVKLSLRRRQADSAGRRFDEEPVLLFRWAACTSIAFRGSHGIAPRITVPQDQTRCWGNCRATC
jgi:hypothetical protein